MMRQSLSLVALLLIIGSDSAIVFSAKVSEGEYTHARM